MINKNSDLKTHQWTSFYRPVTQCLPENLCWSAMATPPEAVAAASSADAAAVSEAENLSIEITVLTLSGETLLVVSLSPKNSTLLDLKREIKSHSGHLIEIQQFSSEETVLIGPDRRKLREFGLVSGSVTLTLVLKGLDVDMHIETLRGKGSMREADDIRILCALSEEIFLKEPPLLELQPPLVMGGHVMGCASQLHYLFDTFGEPSESQYLFLGCYVSRGKRSIDTFTLLLLYKKKYPEKIHLLRGQHESAQISRIYGFYDECKSSWLVVSTYFSWSPKHGMIDSQIITSAIHISSLIKNVLLQQPNFWCFWCRPGKFNVRIWKDFVKVFNSLPFGALIQAGVGKCPILGILDITL